MAHRLGSIGRIGSVALLSAGLAATTLAAGGAAASAPASTPATMPAYTLDFDSKVDPGLQAALEKVDVELRKKFDMTEAQTAVGAIDLLSSPPRLAIVRPDREEYAASVPKVGILLAYFDTHPEATTNLDPTVRHELGLMAKASSNEMAAKYSRLLGLENIQKILTDKYHLYDAAHGGGIWVGKHYGKGAERFPSPVGKNSHAATVRQLLRFWVMLEQGQLVSPEASKVMRSIFASPEVPHDDIKFVKGLKGREGVEIVRKWGSWEDWYHDSAVVTGPGRHYILVALTRHPKGDDYLAALAPAMDDVLKHEK